MSKGPCGSGCGCNVRNMKCLRKLIIAWVYTIFCNILYDNVRIFSHSGM